jgi:hypothetical protein
MRTLLILVNDEIAQTLEEHLPVGKAWILDPRYDHFRCQIHCALKTYSETPEVFETYSQTMSQMDAWLSGQQA